MEQLFTPTRRFQDMWEEDNDNVPFEYAEAKLNVPVETFLTYHWDWADMCTFACSDARPKCMWITDNVVLTVDVDYNMIEFMNRACLSDPVVADLTSKNYQRQTLTLFEIGDDSTLQTGGLAVFWHAISTSDCVKLRLQEWLALGPILSQFLEGSPSLQVLQLEGVYLNEDHCRALATLQRTDLEVTFHRCSLKPKDAEQIFKEWLRRSEIVTELSWCFMESSLLSAISGNNSVKKLIISKHASKDYEKEMLSLFQALPGNLGIEDLIFLDSEMSDETCILLFRSLSTHPCINSLSIPYMLRRLTQESKAKIMNAILQMLHLNTVLLKINLPKAFDNEAVYQNAILPRLEMNRSCFEVQRQAIKRADPSVRPQLLGRVLHMVRYNPNLVFQFLSENVPAFVQTEEQEEEEEEDSAIRLQNNPAIISGQKRKAP